MSWRKLLLILEEEVCGNSVHMNEQISQLVQSFIKYLKEPRYQSPLTLPELALLFSNFYKDLNSLVINLYTQSNSVKKQLISSSEYFRTHADDFDYLLAIANYSTSSVKLLKRTDLDAVLQLRVFNYYKFITIVEAIEKAQAELFNSNNTLDEGISLLEKIFKFDQRDIILQEFLNEKLDALKKLKLPFSCFIENDTTNKLTAFFSSISEAGNENSTLEKIKQTFVVLIESITPYSKLKAVVEIQKSLIILLSEAYDSDPSNVNNDDIIPSLIYIIIYHVPFNSSDLYLNFTFIKNFVNLIDPYNVDINSFTLNSFPASYTPTDRLNRSLNGKKTFKKNNLFEYLNLKEEDDTELETSSNIDFFKNDKDLVHYIQAKYLNNGELKFYLTNFEAVLFFLLSVTIQELVPEGTTENQLLKCSLHKLVDQELLSHFKFPDGKAIDEFKNQEDISPQVSSRSRSSSLLNTISHKLNDVALSVNRSRSNSSIINSLKSSSLSLNKESFPSFAGNHETETTHTSPTNSNESNTVDTNHIPSLMMKNILGRFSLVLVPQFRPSIEEQITTTEADNTDTKTEERDKRSSSLMSKMSLDHLRTRSSSIEKLDQDQNGIREHQKKSSITSKLTNGVSDFMTKFNSTTNGSNGTISTLHANPTKNASNLSIHSFVEGLNNYTDSNITINEDLSTPNGSSATIQRRPDYRNRTTSLQVMDKWFNNISANNNSNPESQENTVGSTTGDNLEEESVTQIKNLTKYTNKDFESLTMKDLKDLKACYDILCNDLVSKSNIKSDKTDEDEPIDTTDRISSSETSI